MRRESWDPHEHSSIWQVGQGGHHKEPGQLLLLGDTGPGTLMSLVALPRDG